MANPRGSHGSHGGRQHRRSRLLVGCAVAAIAFIGLLNFSRHRAGGPLDYLSEHKILDRGLIDNDSDAGINFIREKTTSAMLRHMEPKEFKQSSLHRNTSPSPLSTPSPSPASAMQQVAQDLKQEAADLLNQAGVTDQQQQQQQQQQQTQQQQAGKQVQPGVESRAQGGVLAQAGAGTGAAGGEAGNEGAGMAVGGEQKGFPELKSEKAEFPVLKQEVGADSDEQMLAAEIAKRQPGSVAGAAGSTNSPAIGDALDAASLGVVATKNGSSSSSSSLGGLGLDTGGGAAESAGVLQDTESTDPAMAAAAQKGAAAVAAARERLDAVAERDAGTGGIAQAKKVVVGQQAKPSALSKLSGAEAAAIGKVASMAASVRGKRAEPASPEEAEMVADHDTLVAWLASPEGEAYLEQRRWLRSSPPSRGIVFPAGASLRLGGTYVAIRVLREVLNCTLPIEVHFVGGRNEMDAPSQAEFEALPGVRVVDSATLPYPAHHRKVELRGYLCKVFALYTSAFDEAIVLDSDNTPVVDPSFLFDMPEYVAAGSAFWPDLFVKGLERVPSVQPHAYELFGLPLPWAEDPEWMWAESGQMVIDRIRHADVLEWIWFINAHHEVIYKLAYGDKDTFTLGFALANKLPDYFQVKEFVRLCLGDQNDPALLEHVGILHHDPAGRVIFFHRTSGAKVDPFADTMLTVEWITVPLSGQRAFKIFEGAAKPNNYRFPRDRIDKEAYKKCSTDPSSPFLRRCGVNDTGDDLPVPVIPPSHFPPDSGIEAVLNASYGYFRELQARMKTEGNHFLVHLVWWRRRLVAAMAGSRPLPLR